jgi:hypothetical protein
MAAMDGSWELPGTAPVWVLPLFLPWLALYDLGFDASARAYRVLETGTAGIAAILAIGVWSAWHTRRAGRTRQGSVVLWSFLPTAAMLGLASLWLAESHDFVFIALTPFLTWLFCTVLLPYWRDDEAIVDSFEPATGWKRLFGLRMVYAARENPAVWVKMTNPIPGTDMGFTPNLGHFWGRLVIAMFFLSLVAPMAVAIVAWSAI